MMDVNDPLPEISPAEGDPVEVGGDTSARRRARDSLFLMANIRVAGSSFDTAVRVRNLSEGGLMADLADSVDPDTAVQVEVRGIGWVTGRVAWQVEGRTGIAFDKPIDPQKARKPVGAGNKTPVYAKAIMTRR